MMILDDRVYDKDSPWFEGPVHRRVFLPGCLALVWPIEHRIMRTSAGGDVADMWEVEPTTAFSTLGESHRVPVPSTVLVIYGGQGRHAFVFHGGTLRFGWINRAWLVKS